MLNIERLQSSCLRDAHTLTTALTMALLVTLATDASAARRVWTGKGRDANWTTAQNWEPIGAPNADDTLVFPARAARTTNVNTLPAGARFASLIFDAAYDVGGNALALSQGVQVVGPHAVVVSCGLRRAGADPVTFTVDDKASLNWAGELLHAVDVVKSGAGTLTLAGDIGALTTRGGRIRTGAEVLTLGGPVTNNGESTIEGTLSLGGETRVFRHGGTADEKSILTIEAIIIDGGGASGLTVSGSVLVRLTAANEYSGVTTVSRAGIDVQHPRALGSPKAGTKLIDGGLLLSTDVRDETLEIEAGPTGVVPLHCPNQPFRRWAGPITLTGHVSFMPLDPCLLELAGPIAGEGVLGVGGRLELTADNPFAGETRVGRGRVAISGSVAGPVTVDGGVKSFVNEDVTDSAVLSGTGRIGALMVTQGTVAPGRIAGTLRTGPVTFTKEGALEIRTVGGSQLAVAGTVTLKQAALKLTGRIGEDLAEKDTVVIVDNDERDAIVGTFDKLPEGGVVEVDGLRLRVSYRGGTSNDITLTKVR